MTRYINKADVVAEIERLREEEYPCDTFEESTGYYNALDEVSSFLNTLEVKDVDLTDKKPDWRPSKKQIESLGALVRYNIGVFDYQKLNEVAILYDDLTKI